MKTRRTISAEVLLSPEYRKLSTTAQSLYIYSILNADEYGFINDMYKFVCTGGYKIDDLRPLYNAGFVILFPDDTALIADWFIHTGTTARFDMEHHRTEYDYIHFAASGRFIEQDSLKEKRLSSRKQKAFIPPTLEQVKEYAKSRNSCVDPVEFFNFFNTPNENGDTWVDTKGQLVSNWKGKFVTWEKFRGGNKRAGDHSGHSEQSAARHRSYNLVYDVDGTDSES